MLAAVFLENFIHNQTKYVLNQLNLGHR